MERQEKLEYFEMLGEAANRVEEAMVMIQLKQQQQAQGPQAQAQLARKDSTSEASPTSEAGSRAQEHRRSVSLHNSWRKRSVKPGEAPPVDEMDSATELALSKIRVQKLLGVRAEQGTVPQVKGVWKEAARGDGERTRCTLTGP